MSRPKGIKTSWKKKVKIPHLRPKTITSEMVKNHYRIIDVNNNCGDSKRIIVRDIPEKTGCWKLKIEVIG